MKLLFQDHGTNGIFRLRKGDPDLKGTGILEGGTINTIVCNRSTEQLVIIDQVTYPFPPDSILPLVANQHFSFQRPQELLAWQFNRDFYCIADHDSETGCAGFLFYGIQHPLFIHLSPQELKTIDTIEKLCIEELAIVDGMQGEMLRILLKRLIISTTRAAKRQTDTKVRLLDQKFDLIRKFTLLLEANFRTQHGVRFYADSLNRSPKTLANHFSLFHYPSPSRLIQQRLIREAKRYLWYTDKSAKEIAYLLGFVSPSHFSRFFKDQTGTSISLYRNGINDAGAGFSITRGIDS